MTKKTKGTPTPPPELVAMMIADSGKGMSHKVTDRGTWLDNNWFTDQWVDALEEIDKKDDKKSLLALLRSNLELTPDARWFLADLLERYDLRRPNHSPRVPAYDRSPAESIIFNAKRRVKELVKEKGLKVSEALEKVAIEYSLPTETLALAYNDRRGSTRRLRRRLPGSSTTA